MGGFILRGRYAKKFHLFISNPPLSLWSYGAVNSLAVFRLSFYYVSLSKRQMSCVKVNNKSHENIH